MASDTGDKIGLNMPDDLADNDVWGGIYRAFGATVDELVYANREFRNMSILGGGKIEWDAGTGQVSFDANIVIRDHITSNTVTITTAASPVTLTANQVGYVAKNMKPASNQSITSVTVVSAGSLPNTDQDADMGVLALFHRTSDSTCLVPWAGREILDGDHWQFGAALSWYERIASHAKPSHRHDTTTTLDNVDIDAAATSPKVAIIDGKLYARTTQLNVDVGASGRNGLDTGAAALNTVYYLYAIPPTSGRTFDAVFSVTSPSGGGPTGFSSWSYLGAVLRGGTAFHDYVFSQGRHIHVPKSITQGWTATGYTAETTLTPDTTKNWIGRFTLNPISTNDSYFIDVSINGTDHFISLGGNNDVSGSPRYDMQVEVPMLDASRRVWRRAGAGGGLPASWTADTYQFGWTEDPMEYK